MGELLMKDVFFATKMILTTFLLVIFGFMLGDFIVFAVIKLFYLIYDGQFLTQRILNR